MKPNYATTKAADHSQGSQRRPAAGKLAIAGLALLLAACDEHRRLDDEMAVSLNNHERRHPIHFSQTGEALDIEVPPGAQGLSPNQHADVYRFIERYKRESNGRLTLSLSGSARDRASIQRSLEDIDRLAIEAGIDSRLLRGRRHDQSSRGVATIRLAYDRPVAIGPPCDRWPEDVGRNEERLPYTNWGCTTQHNLALMVDNARDLQRPQAEDPRSGERRSVSWSAYIASSGGANSGGDGGAAPKRSAAPATKQ
jgi:pilus assembly protein CpaD